MFQQNIYDQLDPTPPARPIGMPGGPRQATPQTPEQAANTRVNTAQGIQQMQRGQYDLQAGPATVRTANANAATAETTAANKPDDIRFQRSKDLRSEFNAHPIVRQYNDVLTATAAAYDAANDPGGAGDLPIIYGLAKILDPGSVVREGELTMASGTGSLGQRLQGYYKSVQQGGKLPPEVRRNLLAQIHNKGGKIASEYNLIRQQYSRTAQSYHVDPYEVVGTHPGQEFQQSEANFLRRPVNNMDGTQGPAPQGGVQVLPQAATPQGPGGGGPQGPSLTPSGGGPVTPEEMDRQIKDMLAQRMPADAVRRYVASVGGSIGQQDNAILDAYDKVREQGRTNVGVRTMPAESLPLGVVKGAEHVWDRAAEGLQNGTNWLLGTNSDSATQAAQGHDQYFANHPTDPNGEFWGRMAGATALTAGIGSPTIAGGVAGATMGNSRTPAGIAADTVIGGVAGKVGDTAVRGLGGLIAPRIAPEVRMLHDEGASLTPLQIIDGPARNGVGRTTEAKAVSIPQVGPRIAQGITESVRGLMRAAGNRALRPIGQRLPGNLPDGHAVANEVEQRIGNEYNRVLSQMTVQLDQTFATRIGALAQRAMTRMRPQDANELGEFFQREVGGAFSPGGGQLTGRQYKMLDERLGDMAARYRSSADNPYARDIGSNIRMIQEQMRALARRQNPRLAGDLRRADQAWQQYTIVRNAAQKNMADGYPTPAQLGLAVRESDRSVGRGAAARGRAQMQDLSKAGQQVLPPTVPDSGTAGRLNLLSPKAWMVGGPASMLYTPEAMQTFQNLMMAPRGPVTQAIGNGVRRIPGRVIGPALLPPLQGTGRQ